MIQWYKKVVFENYANFEGRARRSEYWYFVLGNFLISIVFLLFIMIFGGNGMDGVALLFYVLLILYSLAVFLPSLAVAVRRLHDIGKSGWYYLIGLIPFIGGIWLLVLFATEGVHGSNEYGPDPKLGGDINEIGNE